MTPDQYRREGAEAMRETCIRAVNATASPIVGTPYSAGGRAFADAIRAINIDVDEVLAGLPTVTITGGQAVVAVCPICDIAGCRHIREAEKAPDAVARLVEAAKWMRDWSCEGFCRDLPRGDTYTKEMDMDCGGCRVRAALAALENQP